VKGHKAFCAFCAFCAFSLCSLCSLCSACSACSACSTFGSGVSQPPYPSFSHAPRYSSAKTRRTVCLTASCGVCILGGCTSPTDLEPPGSVSNDLVAKEAEAHHRRTGSPSTRWNRPADKIRPSQCKFCLNVPTPCCGLRPTHSNAGTRVRMDDPLTTTGVPGQRFCHSKQYTSNARPSNASDPDASKVPHRKEVLDGLVVDNVDGTWSLLSIADCLPTCITTHAPCKGSANNTSASLRCALLFALVSTPDPPARVKLLMYAQSSRETQTAPLFST
jgi:hypothetical protein